MSAQSGDVDEARDLAQDVLVRALAALPAYDPSHPFEAWLFLIARNRTVDHLRRRGRTSVEEPHALLRRRELAESEQTAAPEADSGFIGLIRGLPRREQQVLLLRYGLGLTPREVGEVIGCSYGAVRMIQTRALARLRPRVAPALAS